MMSTSQKLLGQKASQWLLKRLVYEQFVAGETREEIRAAVEQMQKIHVGPLLAAPMEDDIDVFRPDADKICDTNLEAMVKGMEMARELDSQFPMTQLRISALMPGNFCAYLSQRCPEPSRTPDVIEALASALTGKPLDVEKVFGSGFSEPMRHHLEQGIARVTKVCQKTREILERDAQFAESQGIGFGVKLVRGAYMHKEKKVAASLAYPDPVQDSYDDTSRAYDAAVTSVLNKIAVKPRQYRVIVASHNESSILAAVKGIQQLGIDPCGGSVFFGQLLGMSDHVSCNLALNGFLARKSLPYGSLEDTLPYLSRRAQENSAVFHGVRRERSLLRSELRHRLRPGAA
ncbi:hypothetical protein ACOMHN_011995 [Nucella lapillus]